MDGHEKRIRDRLERLRLNRKLNSWSGLWSTEEIFTSSQANVLAKLLASELHGTSVDTETGRAGRLELTSETELVRRVMANLGYGRKPAMRWVHARDVFGVGSRQAQEMCRAHNLNPDEKIGDLDA